MIVTDPGITQNWACSNDILPGVAKAGIGPCENLRRPFQQIPPESVVMAAIGTGGRRTKTDLVRGLAAGSSMGTSYPSWSLSWPHPGCQQQTD